MRVKRQAHGKKKGTFCSVAGSSQIAMRTGAGYRLFVRVWNAGSAGFLLCRTARTTEKPRTNGTADTTEQLIEGCRENAGTEK